MISNVTLNAVADAVADAVAGVESSALIREDAVSMGFDVEALEGNCGSLTRSVGRVWLCGFYRMQPAWGLAEVAVSTTIRGERHYCGTSLRLVYVKGLPDEGKTSRCVRPHVMLPPSAFTTYADLIDWNHHTDAASMMVGWSGDTDLIAGMAVVESAINNTNGTSAENMAHRARLQRAAIVSLAGGRTAAEVAALIAL